MEQKQSYCPAEAIQDTYTSNKISKWLWTSAENDVHISYPDTVCDETGYLQSKSNVIQRKASGKKKKFVGIYSTVLQVLWYLKSHRA